MGTRFIFYFDGNSWKEKLALPTTTNIYMKKILEENDHVYLFGSKPAPLISNETDTLCFWIFNKNSLNTIFSKTINEIKLRILMEKI